MLVNLIRNACILKAASLASCGDHFLLARLKNVIYFVLASILRTVYNARFGK